jgi:integrase
MEAKVSLRARVNIDGFPTVPAEINRRAIVLPVEGRNGRLKGRFFNLEDIIGFYAVHPDPDNKGHRLTKALGKDPVTAYTLFTQTEQDFSRMRQGLLPVNVEPAKKVEGTRGLRYCATEYKSELEALGKKKSTIAMYARAVDDFVTHCHKTFIDDVDRKDILDYLGWMKANLKRRADGDSQHALRNRVRYLSTFFNRFGLKCPLPMKEIKKPAKRRPWKYSLDVVKLFLSKANREEKDLIHFLLNTGFRDEETAYATWSNIDLTAGSINVFPNDAYHWTPKDGESREQDIVLSPEFVKIMQARKERMNPKGADLIFPTVTGKPNNHLIKIVRRAAKKVGFEGKVSLHAFRRTFGTTVAKHYNIEQARIWLGHSDIETTQRYLAADELTTDQSRKIASRMFAQVGD